MAESKAVNKGMQKSRKRTTASSEGFTAEERAAMKERARELKAAARRGRAAKADGESDVLDKIAEMPEPDRGRAAPRCHQGRCAGPRAEALVRDAGLRQGRQGGLLFSECAEVQDEVRDARLQRQGQPRRRRHVADHLRSDEVDRRRRGKDRRTGGASGE